MGRARTLARWSGRSLVAILVVAVVAVLITETAWFKDWVRTQIVTRTAGALNGTLRIGRLEGSLWSGVTLADVEFVQPDGRVVNAAHIHVRYDPFLLATGRWVLDSVRLDRADINLVETARGWNVTQLTKPRDTPGEPPSITIRSIELTNSTVTVAPLNAAKRVLLNVELEAALQVTAGIASLNIESLRAHDSTSGLTLREFSGASQDNFRVFNATFAADSATTRLAGSVRGDMTGGARAIAAQVDVAHLDLATFIGDRRYATDITGRIDARTELTGDARGPRVTFALSGSDSRAFGYAVSRINARGNIVGGVVSANASVRAYGAAATIDGVWTPGRGRTPWTMKGRGTYASVDLRRMPSHLNLPRLESRISGRYTLTTRGGVVRAHTTLTGGTIEGATMQAGTEAELFVGAGETSYAGIGAVRGLNPERLGRALNVATLRSPTFSGNLSGEFAVAGRHVANQPPLIVAGARLEKSTIAETTLDAFQASMVLAERRLFAFGDASFTGLTDKTLGLASPSVSAQGSLNAWVHIADVDQPLTEHNVEAGARVNLGPSSIRGVAIDAAALSGQFVDGVVTLHTLDLQSPEASLHAEGALGITDAVDGPGMKLALQLHDRTFVERLIGSPVRGAGSIDATVTGSVGSPAATGTITLNQAAYGESASALVLRSEFKADWPDRVLDRLTFDTNTSASFVTLAGTEIQQLTATAAGAPRAMDVAIQLEQRERALGVDGRLTLDPASRSLTLSRLALTTADVEWSLPTGQHAVIQYGADRVTVNDLVLGRGTQQIAIGGSFDLEPPADSADAGRLAVTMREVELADINRALLGTRRLTGRINGSLTVEGHGREPLVEADVVIRDGTVEDIPYLSVQARGRYAAQTATIDATLDQAPGLSLRAAGTVPMGSGAPMNVRVSGGPVNIGLVQAFTTEIDNVTGNASFDLVVGGSRQHPLINGSASLTQGGFDLGATGVAYRAIEADLQFTGTRLAISRFQAADPDGDLITATGGLDVLGAAARTIDIEVRAARFSVLDNRFGIASMNAQLHVSGEIGAPVIRGTAALESGRLEVAGILDQATARPYSTTPEGPVGEAPRDSAKPASPLDRADIVLELRVPDNLVLRGRDLRVSRGGFGIGDMNVVTGGAFTVRKQPGGSADVVGTLEIVRGSYSFQGRRFDIGSDSNVRFRGGPPTDPFLNVNATREVSGITAEVRLRGTAQSPELTLASRPPLDESEILSLIVFNQPINALGSGERANLGERAASIAAGAITTPLSDSIARALNLDLVEIQAPTGSSAGALTVGSQVGSRVFVGLKQQFGLGESSLLTLEYRVNEMLRFVTSIARGTLQAHATRRVDRAGVDLIFLIRY